jgi:hypothetical protein
MRHIERRLHNLEVRQHHGQVRSHFIAVVHTPWELDDAAVDRWLQEELRCPCGVVGCEHLRIGALLPEKAPSVEAWAERWQWDQRRDHGAAKAARWYRRSTGADGNGPQGAA